MWQKLIRFVVISLVIWGAVYGVRAQVDEETAVTPTETASNTAADLYLYLPILMALPAPIQPGDGRLHNPSFEEGWTDLPPAPGYLINQQPQAWTLTWIEPGQPLYNSTDLAAGVPECVHKLNDQLPPDEQLGGPHALILDGETTYKLFHANAPFGAELRQTIYGLTPGTHWQITVPMQVHLHEDPDPFGAEAGVWVNGVGSWVNGAEMGDRAWYEHVVSFTVPANGQAEVVIRVKSKWPRAKDFFTDYLRLQAAAINTDNFPTTPSPLEFPPVAPID
ncbi:MAG: hypothetical protein KC443_10330 [Anaerolineales bacterium]|nr:hypothetical protein [Anaerolineales bacterium]